MGITFGPRHFSGTTFGLNQCFSRYDQRRQENGVVKCSCDENLFRYNLLQEFFFEASYKFQLNEGKSAYKVIRMQLQDLPLLLAGALGAAITGMVAPGLSFLFGEIQKVTTFIIYLLFIK